MDTLCITTWCITHAETRSMKAQHRYCERQYNGGSLKSIDAYIHAHNDIHIWLVTVKMLINKITWTCFFLFFCVAHLREWVATSWTRIQITKQWITACSYASSTFLWVITWSYPFRWFFKFRNEFCTWEYGYEAVCSFMCVFFRTAVSIVLVAKGNSRLELFWLPTRLTLTPKVNALYKCVCGFIGFIATYVTDWWPQWHMWWAPCVHIILCVHVCVSGGI